MNDIRELLASLNLEGHNLQLYETALTHSSCNIDKNCEISDYERLEYIGDSVIGFVSADLIYKIHEEMDQGLMSKLRSYLVCSRSLASYSRLIGLQNYIRTGHSISHAQLEKSDKILEDVFEALTGAIYLDLGIEVAYEFVRRFLEEDVRNTGIDAIVDAKTRLQEEFQSEYREAVQYVLIDESGPAHDRTFEVEVRFNGIILGRGIGKSKKQAEEAAAADALSKRSV